MPRYRDSSFVNELAQEAIGRYLQSIEVLTAELREAEEEADREGWLTSGEVKERLDQRFRRIA